MKVCVRVGQSLVDLALMTTGALEGVWALALRNGLGVTDALEEGAEIDYEWADVEDARTAQRYEAEGISPATEVSGEVLAALLNAPEERWTAAYEMITADAVIAQSTRAAVHTEAFTTTFA